MVWWHEDEAQLSRQSREPAVGGTQGNGGRGVGVEGNPTKGMGKGRTTGVVGKLWWTAVE